MKKLIVCTVMLLGMICVNHGLAQTVVTRRDTLSALDFNYFQGTAQYLDSAGLVEGASTSPFLTGSANVTLPDGATMVGLKVCGQDNASDQEFSADLKRKSLSTLVTTFSPSQVLAHVASGVTFASSSTVCLTAAVPSTVATVNNGGWAYYVELTIGDTVEVIAAKVIYTCTLGGTC